MGTSIHKRTNVEAKAETIAKLESHLPEGWKFCRAGYHRNVNHGEGVRVFFAKVTPSKDERRPKLRCQTLEQVKALTPQLLRAVALAHPVKTGKNPKNPNETWGPEGVIIDVLLSEKQTRELFNLGDNVRVLGVRTNWPGGKKWDGKATGFSVRCRASVK